MAKKTCDADAHILVIVDTVATIENVKKGKEPVVYLVDDDPTDDSGQGSTKLVTHIPPNAKVTWKATAINNEDTVGLINFDDKGADNFFNKLPVQDPGYGSWTGRVGNLPPKSKARYGFNFCINGEGEYYFDPELEVGGDPPPPSPSE